MAAENSDRRIKDLSAILETVACAEAVLARAQKASSYGWENDRHGHRPRRSYGSGPTTRGSMAKSRSGQHTVSPARFEQWSAECGEVDRIRASALWNLLRPERLKPSTLPEVDKLGAGVLWTLNRRVSIPGIEYLPLPADTAALQRLAGLRSFDGVAALLILTAEVQDEDPELAIERGRYLPPALALLAATPAGSRTAFVILARIRQTTLDALCFRDQRILLREYDFPAAVASGRDLECTKIIQDPNRMRYWNKLTRTADATVAWLMEHRPVIGVSKRRPAWPWKAGLGLSTHPQGPLHKGCAPGYHKRTVARISATLDRYAH